jgi:HlyD family secretion protein
MKNSKQVQLWMLAAILLQASCSTKGGKADAYGHFEATETIISSKSSGEILTLLFDKGDKVEHADILMHTDTIDLYLQKQQLIAQKASVMAQEKSVYASINVISTTIKGLTTEQDRLAKLLNDGAATQQQMDNLDNKLEVARQQILVHRAQIHSIKEQAAVFDAQLAVIDKKIDDCIVKSPVSGIILERYTEIGELATPGKPLFKIAPVETIYLRVYISGNQLHSILIGSTVTVKIDGAGGKMKSYKGEVSWISSEAEFTPKVVQTKEERVKQVYATKIKVVNDGSIKIGMPGEMWLK